MEGDTSYYCEHCNCKQRAQKRTTLHKLPEVFVIHLNRARWLLHGKKEKLQNHVLVRACYHLCGDGACGM